MRDSNWLCLDCSKDTFDEYYGVQNYLWRRVVDRSQRHGMLCLLCLERRLGRYGPMNLDDYGLIDELTPDALCQIDAALKSLATAKPKKVAAIIGRVMAYSPARVPGLPDYFYLERMRLLVESGVLRLVGDIEDPMRGEVFFP
jgi:hypothetical protein